MYANLHGNQCLIAGNFQRVQIFTKMLLGKRSVLLILALMQILDHASQLHVADRCDSSKGYYAYKLLY